MNIIDRLLEHNCWATRILIEKCRGLSEEQLTQNFEMGLGNVHDTLVHIIGAMRSWTDRLCNRPSRPPLLDEKRIRTPDEMLQLLDMAAAELGEGCRKIKDDRRINDMMTHESKSYMKKWEFTLGTVIVHVATHGVHHRAQCLNMLRQLGVKDLPDLDAIDWEVSAGNATENEL